MPEFDGAAGATSAQARLSVLDGVSIIIDSPHDQRSGFVFRFNPAGARRDGQVSNDHRNNVDWDGVWDLQTRIHDDGWSAEWVIPFKTLGPA